MSCFIRLQILETSMALKLFSEKVLALSGLTEMERLPLLWHMNPDLVDVAKTLIELGANVNAYRPGRNAGTPLHHAAKEAWSRLLNCFFRNDNCHTPLEVARIKGCTNVVRAIENHICYFSSWLREFCDPGFLGGFSPQLLSRKIWVVIEPCGSGNPMKPPKFELAMYSTLQVSVSLVVCM